MKLVDVRQGQTRLCFEIGKLLESLDARWRSLLTLRRRQTGTTTGDATLLRRVNRARVVSAHVTKRFGIEVENDLYIRTFARAVLQRVQLLVADLLETGILELRVLFSEVQQRP